MEMQVLMLLVFIKAKGLTDAFGNALITVSFLKPSMSCALMIAESFRTHVRPPAHPMKSVECAQVRRALRGLSKLVPVDAVDRELLQFQARVPTHLCVRHRMRRDQDRPSCAPLLGALSYCLSSSRDSCSIRET